MLKLTLFATEVSLHDQNRPPNSCTPMMAKMRKNRPTTMDTLAMDANDKVTERKTSIMPGLLVRVLQVSTYSLARHAKVASLSIRAKTRWLHEDIMLAWICIGGL